MFDPDFDYVFQDIELAGRMNVSVLSPGLLIISGFVSYGTENKY